MPATALFPGAHMDRLFPRTTVGGVSVSRLIIGTNWLLGWSHTSAARDRQIRAHHTRQTIADVLAVFLDAGVDTLLGPVNPLLAEAVCEVQQRTGRRVIQILTPGFNIRPGGDPAKEPEPAFDRAHAAGATFCLPHESATDALVDRRDNVIRDWPRLAALIRSRGMIPGLSTHLPQSIVIADKTGADVETYITIYNCAGFMMPLEIDWTMRVIANARKPVLTIKPLAAGRLLPPVGLAFAWNTIRDQDMVAVGCYTPDEAREVLELSLAFLDRRLPQNELQTTRSKQGLT